MGGDPKADDEQLRVFSDAPPPPSASLPPPHSLDVLKLAMRTQEEAFRVASAADGTARLAHDETRRLGERVAVLEQHSTRRSPLERYLDTTLKLIALAWLAWQLTGKR